LLIDRLHWIFLQTAEDLLALADLSLDWVAELLASTHRHELYIMMGELGNKFRVRAKVGKAGTCI
jgi:hypothetical protein